MELTNLFRNLVKLAAADGKFTDEEIRFLVNRAEGWGIGPELFEEVIAEVGTGDNSIRVPESPADREHLLKEMIRLMAVDGELAETERRFCARASVQMQFTPEQFAAILDDLLGEK